jgi:hypothetical protein
MIFQQDTTMNNHNKRVLVGKILPLADCGNLKAFANVYLPHLDIVIRYLRIVQQPDMQVYCAMPQTEWYSKSGEKHFATVLTLPESLKKEICASVLAAWETKQQ